MSHRSEYRLTIRIDIERWQGDADSTSTYPTSERLGVHEDVQLGAMDFLGVTQVLARLHEVADQLRPAAEGAER